MNLKCSVLFLVTILFFQNQYLLAQERIVTGNFEIQVAGFKIGEMNARQISTGTTQSYEISSNVSFWFFGRIELVYSVDCEYKNGQLIDSKVFSNSNRGQFRSFVKWSGNHYRVDAESYRFQNTTTIPNPITGSTATFYFRKPRHGEVIISETFGILSPVVEKEKDVFEIEIDGNRNQFHYKGDRLEKVVIQNPIKNYVIQRVE